MQKLDIKLYVKSQICNKKCWKYAKMSSRILSDFFVLIYAFSHFSKFQQ